MQKGGPGQGRPSHQVWLITVRHGRALSHAIATATAAATITTAAGQIAEHVG